MLVVPVPQQLATHLGPASPTGLSPTPSGADEELQEDVGLVESAQPREPAQTKRQDARVVEMDPVGRLGSPKARHYISPSNFRDVSRSDLRLISWTVASARAFARRYERSTARVL
jgi:hypothetical protein